MHSGGGGVAGDAVISPHSSSYSGHLSNGGARGVFDKGSVPAVCKDNSTTAQDTLRFCTGPQAEVWGQRDTPKVRINLDFQVSVSMMYEGDNPLLT